MEIQVGKLAELRGHHAPIYSIGEAPEDGRFYSGGGDRTLFEWDWESGSAPRPVAKTPGVIYTSCLLPGKRIVLIGNSLGGIHVIDLQQKREVKYLLAHQDGVFRIRIHPERKVFYVAGADGAFSVWEYSGFTCVFRMQICELKIRDIAISPSGEYILLACGDGLIRVLACEDYREINSWRAHETSVNAIKFHPDGNYLLSGGKDAHLNIWDVSNPGMAMEKIPAHNYAIYSIEFQPNGKVFATASRDKTVKLWDGSEMKFLLRIEKDIFGGHSHSVNTLLWSHDGAKLATGGDDRNLYIWDVKTS